MRRLIIALVLLIAVPCVAADYSKSLTFQWNQTATDIPNLKEWGLYPMTASGGTKDTRITIPYTSGTGPFQAASSFTVTGLPGSVVRRYFVLDAVSKNDNRSGFSNEVFFDFQIPFSDVTVPMSLTVTASVVAP